MKLANNQELYLMKAINWLITNLSNLLSITGIILTLYFGIFYIPSWLKEAKTEKQNNAVKDIKQSIKELVYNDSLVNIYEISTLIEAKEIELNQNFPYSTKQVLTISQESFAEDNFLPIERRKELIKKIEILKKQLPKPKETKHNVDNISSISLVSLTSILLTLSTVIFGIIGIFKRKKEEDNIKEELGNEINITNEYQIKFENNRQQEQNLIKIIEEIEGINILEYGSNFDKGYDLKFNYNNKDYFVEFKFLTKSKVGLQTINKIINFTRYNNSEIWLIYNTDLTSMVKDLINDFNEKHVKENVVFRPIKFNNVEIFQIEIQKLLNINNIK